MEKSADTTDHAIAVTVVRSGGFAGLKRTWEASTDDPGAAEGWLGLVDSLPWGQTPRQDPHSADRFVYRISIVVRTKIRHETILPESELTGGWRDLVDRVQKEDHAGTV